MKENKYGQTGHVASIEGVCPVLSVPFDQDGEVDYESFKSLVTWIIGLGTKSVLFFGVASENMKLTDPERYKLLDMLLNLRTGSDLKVIASVADHSSELAVKRAKDYELMGADFINILPPSFLSPNAEQIGYHLSQILGAVKIPVIIQHLPQSGGMSDVASLITLVDEFPNLAMVKCEAFPPTESIKRVAELTSGRVKTLIGWGGIFWEVGAVAGASGIQPGCGLTDLYLWANRALLDGDLNEFSFRLNQFIPWVADWITDLELLIAVEKHILFKRGIIKSNYCRHPTSPITAANEKEIELSLKLIGEVDFKNG
jgi:2-keto-3-deoxy-L-arabinonate dehydratase